MMIKGEPIKILLAEDDPAHVAAIQRALKTSALDIQVRVSGTLATFRQAVDVEVPDIALVDLNLPDGNTIDILTAPPDNGPFPVVIMTSYGNEQVAVEALKAGALDYVVKSPQIFAEMPHTVERAMREWKLLQERKQIEKTLRKSEINFRRSLDDSPLGVRVVSAAGETIYANRQLLDFYGYDSVAELNQTPLRERYTPQSYGEFKKRRKARKQGNEGPSEYEIGIVKKNGEVRHLQVFRKPVLWNGEQQFQVLYRDVTESKHWLEKFRGFKKTIHGQKLLLAQQSSSVEELIKRLTRSNADLERSYETLKAKKDELVRSEKLAFTGRMAAGIAHEIRNPLTNVILSIRQLKKSEKIKPEGLKYAAIVEKNTNRIEYLITELLNCARPIKLNLQLRDIHLLIKDILNIHKVRLKTQRIKVIKNLTVHPSVLLFDKEQLGRVLLNLIANAIEAMRPGGDLSIVSKRGKSDFVIIERRISNATIRTKKEVVRIAGCNRVKEAETQRDYRFPRTGRPSTQLEYQGDRWPRRS